MKKKKWFIIIIGLILIFLPPVYADSPVWKVVKGDQHLFLGGTIHVLAKSDYPLPKTFEKAYTQCDTVVFETDLQQAQTPEFQQLMKSKMLYTDGRTLKTVLNEATFKEVENYLSSRGVPVANFLPLKAGMTAITLSVIEMQRLGMMGTGVDEFFLLRAINDQKQIRQLEAVDEQLAFITELGEGVENEIISYTLRDIKDMPARMKELKDAWRQGDEKKLIAATLTPIKGEFPKLYDELILKRNNAWLPKMEALLQTKEVELVLVGAAHLVGEDGLLAQLAAKGYEIQAP